MKREAIFLYKHLSNLEFRLGFITLQEYLLRLITLYDLSGNSEEVIREIPRQIFERNFSQNLYEEVPHFNENEIEPGEEMDVSKEKLDKEFVMHFITPNAGKFTRWLFRVGDPDFFPSIPHGHSISNSKVKLDCYLGYFYNTYIADVKKRLIGRESRQYTIDLWNNDSFRTLAITSIDWYLDRFPSYHWRVAASRIKILPKKR